MRAALHALIVALVPALPARMCAQSAIRVLPGDYNFGLGDLRYTATVFGIGYDHDLNEHLAFGVDLGFHNGGRTLSNSGQLPSVLKAWELLYRSYFLTGDNERTTFYVGSWAGVRRTGYTTSEVVNGTSRMKEGSTWSVPFGIRSGIRGGLEGFFGDLFATVGYRLGGKVPVHSSGADDTRMEPFSGPEVRFGLNLGVGWDHRVERNR